MMSIRRYPDIPTPDEERQRVQECATRLDAAAPGWALRVRWVPQSPIGRQIALAAFGVPDAYWAGDDEPEWGGLWHTPTPFSTRLHRQADPTEKALRRDAAYAALRAFAEAWDREVAARGGNPRADDGAAAATRPPAA